jgi:hypothetical protein
MNIRSVISCRLFGCLALAASFIAASVGYARARSHIVPPSPSSSAPVLILDDKSFGKDYWLVPGLSSEFGLIQFTGSPYRARHTNIYLGTCIASVPLTIPWLLAVIAVGLTAVVLLFQRTTYKNAQDRSSAKCPQFVTSSVLTTRSGR